MLFNRTSAMDIEFPQSLNITLGLPLRNQGINSVVYEVDYDKVAKIIPRDASTDPIDELKLTLVAHTLMIGPKVYGAARNSKEGIILMKRYDLTLAELLYACQGEVFSVERQRLYGTIERLIQRMHMNGIAHRDLTMDNILVDLDGTVVIADYGRAYFSRNEADRRIDFDSYKKIGFTLRRMETGKIFDSPVHLTMETSMHSRL